jgi:YD repeat-containing protein
VYTLQGQTKTLKAETQTTRLNNQLVTVTKNYEYTGSNHFQPTKITTTNSTGAQLIARMYYPNDLGNEPLMSDLKAQNRKATPIRVENFNGTLKISEQKMSFAKDASTSSYVLPKINYGAKFPNSFPAVSNIGNLEKKLTYDSYDSAGNLTQYTPEGGVPVSIIWGYNKTQPIAKIENATYTSIASYVSNLETLSNSGTQTALIAGLNQLRTAFPNAMVTTYTHSTQLGVTSITDPKGQTIYYNYDGLGRLKSVKDAQGNVLGENEYHYKNPSNQSLF